MKQNNFIVGQSGGPTAVINASLAGVFQTAKELGAGKVLGMLYGIEGLLNRRYLNLLEHIQDEEIQLLLRTPASYLSSCRFKLPDAADQPVVYEKIFEILRELEIGYFLYIGGNDSMDTIHKLSDYAKAHQIEINFIGIPKTIDNDLAITDHTPGFGSAAKFIATVLKETVRDALVYRKTKVTIIEIMGRNAGWLTAAAALCNTAEERGIDLILLPEVPFSVDAFLEKIKELIVTERSLVIAVSEGIRLPNNDYVFHLHNKKIEKDSFGHVAMGGTARVLADLVSANLGCSTRAIELNTLQRSCSFMASKTDLEEAFCAGKTAVCAALSGETGKVVTFRRISSAPYEIAYETADLEEVVNVEKTVPLEWISKDGMNITPPLVDYLRPLIQGEVTPIMKDGLPQHLMVYIPQ